MRKNIILYAPPAAGKGTICEDLQNVYGYEVISIGQVLRNARNPETEVGQKIIACQDQGILVPDDIVGKALQAELIKYQDKPFVLDGYPRNIDQAHVLDSILTNYIVINLNVERELAEKRTLGRATCTGCGKIYNIYFEEKKPKQEGICDICNSPLDVRKDDNANAFKVRFDIYESNAPEILDYFENKGVLYKVDAGHSSEMTRQQVDKILEEGNE